ncbi:MAG: hypothetical protein OD918_07810 [Gammaproteobacteria bacterium]
MRVADDGWPLKKSGAPPSLWFNLRLTKWFCEYNALRARNSALFLQYFGLIAQNPLQTIAPQAPTVTLQAVAKTDLRLMLA